jgi:hypothetical protein
VFGTLANELAGRCRISYAHRQQVSLDEGKICFYKADEIDVWRIVADY